MRGLLFMELLLDCLESHLAPPFNQVTGSRL